jgi:hypothetical protein
MPPERLLVGLLIFSPYPTVVAFNQSSVGLTLDQVSIIGTSLHVKACRLKETGETKSCIAIWL